MKARNVTPYDFVPVTVSSVKICMILIKAPQTTTKISINGEEMNDWAVYSGPQTADEWSWDYDDNNRAYLRFICGVEEVGKIETITVNDTSIQFQDIPADQWVISNTDDIPQQICEQDQCIPAQICEQKYYQENGVTIYFEIMDNVS